MLFRSGIAIPGSLAAVHPSAKTQALWRDAHYRALALPDYTELPMSDRPEDPLLKGARREMLAAATVWAVALIYTVGVCTQFGYGRDPKTLTYVLGFPDWVFWGIVVPWAACTLIAAWFAFGFMTDETLE